MWIFQQQFEVWRNYQKALFNVNRSTPVRSLEMLPKGLVQCEARQQWRHCHTYSPFNVNLSSALVEVFFESAGVNETPYSWWIFRYQSWSLISWDVSECFIQCKPFDSGEITYTEIALWPRCADSKETVEESECCAYRPKPDRDDGLTPRYSVSGGWYGPDSRSDPHNCDPCLENTSPHEFDFTCAVVTLPRYHCGPLPVASWSRHSTAVRL